MYNEEKIEMSEINNLPFGITDEEFENQEDLINFNENEVSVNDTNKS